MRTLLGIEKSGKVVIVMIFCMFYLVTTLLRSSYGVGFLSHQIRNLNIRRGINHRIRVYYVSGSSTEGLLV